MSNETDTTASPLTRRGFLSRSAAAGAAMALPGALRDAGAAPAARPNFVFVLVDDLRWDALSCAGDPMIRTPHIDRIAAEGALFENAFVTISLCSPSRGCFLTGQYAHTHGVIDNRGSHIAADSQTFPLLLQRAGYNTGYAGKWHMGARDDPRPGFDRWVSFKGQGNYNGQTLNVDGQAVPQQGYITDVITDYAVEFARQKRDKPFCLYVGHKAVHGPFTPAARHAGKLADTPVPRPPSFDDDLAGKPEWMRQRARPKRDAAGHEQFMRRYHETILAVDDGVGRLADALREAGTLDDTVFVFTSDNGYFFGDHGLGDKRAMYEEALRIPLFIRYPRMVKAGSRVGPMALNIDIAPTFLDLAGVPVPGVMQGRSLRPLLEGKQEPVRDSFLYEYFAEQGFPTTPTILGVRTPRWAYMTYPDIKDKDELYDIQADPTQMRNLAEDPKHADTLTQMRAELERLKKETGYQRAPAAASVAASPVRDKWVLVYDFSADQGSDVKDSSGQGNHGTAAGVSLAEGRRGKARRFDGKGQIDVPKTPSQNPAGGTWSVEAVVKADAPDGMVLARGGRTQGYALYLKGGVPTFAVTSENALTTVAGKEKVTGEWVHLAGVIGAGPSLLLYVNGALAGKAKLPRPIKSDPNDGMQIGGDLKSPVDEAAAVPGFRGLVERVRLFAGERTAEQVKADYGEAQR